LPLVDLIQTLLEAKHLKAQDIDLVIAHGNGNQKSDDSEAQAIIQVFGAKQVAVTAFKWLMGHTLAASGLLDSVLGVASLVAQTSPALLNGQVPAQAAENLDLVFSHREQALKHVMVMNRGFGSLDALALFRACAS
jgi:3-oxoacyl-[acyl-carrier-protein] synthase-1